MDNESCLNKIGIYEKAFPDSFSLSDKITALLESGFDYLELSADRTDQKIARLTDPLFINQVRTENTKHQHVIRSLCLSALSTYSLGHPSLEIRQRGESIFWDAISFAEKTGISLIQIPFCDVPKAIESTEATQACFFQEIVKLNGLLQTHSTQVRFENMEQPQNGSVSSIISFLNQIPHSHFGIYPDVGNVDAVFNYQLSSALKDLSLFDSKYGDSVHLKETRPNKYGGLYYGQGMVHFPALIQKCRQLGKHFYTLEYWYLGDCDALEYMKSIRRQMDDIINGDLTRR
jgi:L-ribulose-5-phosphate 3-epimerase